MFMITQKQQSFTIQGLSTLPYIIFKYMWKCISTIESFNYFLQSKYQKHGLLLTRVATLSSNYSSILLRMKHLYGLKKKNPTTSVVGRHSQPYTHNIGLDIRV